MHSSKSKVFALIILAIIFAVFLFGPEYRNHFHKNENRQELKSGHEIATANNIWKSASLPLGGQQAQSSPSRQPPKHFQLLSAEPQESKARFTIGEYSIREVELKGKKYSVVTAEDGWTSAIKNAPALPVFRCDFTVPASKPYDFTVLNSTTREIKCAPPLPSPGMLLRNESPGEPTPNPAIYNSSGIYPQNSLTRLSSYKIREVSGNGIAISPFRYDFAKGVLIVSDSIDFALQAESATESDYAPLDKEWNFSTIQSSGMLNSELLRTGNDTTAGNILILVPSPWTDGVQEFVNWKKSMGFACTVAAYPSDTGSGAAALSQFIAQAYAQHSITHIILCGDTEDVPPAYISSNTEYPSILEPTSDTRYAMVSGNDYMADMFISRVPAHSSSQLESVFSKLIAYEAAPPEEDLWRNKGIFIASLSTASTSPYTGMSDKDILQANKLLLQNAGIIDPSSTEIYPPGTSAAKVNTAINNGASFLYYLGHGTATAFTTSNFSATYAKALQNGSMLPFIMSPVCNNGNFAYSSSDCLAEAFFLTNSNAPDNGAIAVLAATSETYWNPPIKSIYTFTEKLLETHTPDRLTDFGAFCWTSINAGAAMAEATGNTSNTAFYYVRQMHLFGDCSSLARLTNLRNITISTGINNNILTVSANWTDDNAPVPGAFLRLTTPGENARTVFARTGLDGSAALDFGNASGLAHLYVNDPGARPITLSIPLAPLSLTNTLEGMPISPISVNVLPAGKLSANVHPLTALPEGLTLSAAGILEGTPAKAGVFSFTCTMDEVNLGPCILTVSTSFYTNPDLDNDGTVSSPELLKAITECNACGLPEETLNKIIKLWTDGGCPQNTRAQHETLEAPSYPQRNWEADVAVTDRTAFLRLENAGADLVSAWEGFVHIYATAETLDWLANNGYEVSNIRQIQQTRASLYMTPQELNRNMRELASSNWNICRPEYIGTSGNRQEILALRISAAPDSQLIPQLLVAACIHGNERPSMTMAWKLAQYLVRTYQSTGEEAEYVQNLISSCSFTIVPCVNPDGCKSVSRYNARNADLNRAFPDGVEISPLGTFHQNNSMHLAGRQPEAQAFMRWCASRRFSAALHLHTGDRLVCYPYGNYKSHFSQATSPDDILFKSLANAYADANPDISTVMLSSQYYPAVGEMADWQYRFLGTLAITVELTGSNGIGKECSTQSQLDTLWNNNRPAFLAWAQTAKTGVTATITSKETGKPIPYATISVDQGQVMAADANGVIHRPLTPGSHTLTASAHGFITSPINMLNITDGQSSSMSIQLQPQFRKTPQMSFNTPRHLPTINNSISITVSSHMSENTASIINLAHPAAWSLSEISSADASRREENGSASFLLINGNNCLLNINAIPDDAPDRDCFITATCLWDGGQSHASRHWISAEKKQMNISVGPGWNLLGIPAAFPMDKLPENLGVWEYNGNETFTQTETLTPGKAVWLLMNRDSSLQSYNITAWHTDRLQPYSRKGWNLLSTPWDRHMDSFVFNRNTKTYSFQNYLKTGQAFWFFNYKNTPFYLD